MDSPPRMILLSAIFLTTMVSSYSQKIPIIQGNSLGKWMAARFKDLLIILFTRESQFTTTRRSAWRGLQTKRVQPETYSHPSDSSPGCSNGPLPVFSTVGSSLSGAQSGPLPCQWPGGKMGKRTYILTTPTHTTAMQSSMKNRQTKEKIIKSM